MLLREMLSHTHLKIEDQRALAICLNALDGEERADLSERILERIEGSSGDWAHNRNSSLLRAELIEAFAPPVVGSLGDQALRRIEAIIPRIKSAPRARPGDAGTVRAKLHCSKTGMGGICRVGADR